MSGIEFDPSSNVIPLFGRAQKQPGLGEQITGHGTENVSVVFADHGLAGIDPSTIVYPSLYRTPQVALDLIVASDDPSLKPEQRAVMLTQAKEIIANHRLDPRN